METFTFADVAIEVPDRIKDPHRRTWAKLGGLGSWWTGAERVAIADEIRRAMDCALCATRREALSTGAAEGEHDSSGVLPAVAVEAVHKQDRDRLGPSVIGVVRGVGRGRPERRALLGVIGLLVAVFSIDELEPLPAAEPGAPERRRPSAATLEGAWFATVPAAALDPEDADIYGGGRHAPNVVRALSLVPENVRTLGDLHSAHYLSYDEMRIIEKIRNLSRSQMELVAARTSALNECFY